MIFFQGKLAQDDLSQIYIVTYTIINSSSLLNQTLPYIFELGLMFLSNLIEGRGIIEKRLSSSQVLKVSQKNKLRQ